ncbi:MAG: penicillin-binding protein activator LpoB [Cellvibrionaceae bacterium]|nr:penicillin-binding protein activator LpoB [Cellvibrionaceae bacterium]
MRFVAFLLALLIFGCAEAPTRVERIAADSVTDLSGQWNDTDSRLVSQEMVSDMLARPWITNHRAAQNKPPAVIVGYIRNLSQEHISVDTFVNDIKRELINSNQVDFVADSQEREQLRYEREDQDLNASAASRKAMGEELGADYMLLGAINTLLDRAGKTQVTYYQVDLKLISLTDNRTLWIGQKKIKKRITNGKSYY